MGGAVIFTAFADTLGQLGDPRFRGVLIKGVGLTIGLLFALYALVFFGTGWLLPDVITLPWIGEIGFANTLVSWGSLILMVLLSVFLMIPVASAFTGLFLDEVADAVEARHYPELGPAPQVGLADNLRETLKFLGILILANLAALLFYFTPFAPFLFYGLNGFLLAREYFRMIAVRRLGRREAGVLFRRHLIPIWGAGVLMALPLTIPIMNLVVPILGAATFTHIFHRLR
ncbi:MAG: EI24 domain-containing protein [Silicimonas sp.]|nr:EI24 domain-containing protein [Silicimonas sp.]